MVGAVGVVALVVAFLIGVPRALPAALALYRSDIWFEAATGEKQLFVTIDDAPSRSTDEILKVLEKHGGAATFFIIADRVKSPTQLQEIIIHKQALGNHLKTTRACSKLTLAEFRSDFDACASLLEQYTKPRFFRPASDFGTREQIAYARSRGYQAIMGTVFPLDHWITDVTWLVCIARWEAVSGGIVILHDGDDRGRRTAAVLDRLIPQWKADGYSFGRLEQSLSQPPEPTGESALSTAGAHAGVARGFSITHEKN